MDLFKKLEVPEELPDLELESDEDIKNQKSSKKPEYLEEEADKTKNPESSKEILDSQEKIEIDSQNSFFQDILEKLESNDPKKIAELHKSYSNDLLEEMKEYWLKQNTSTLLGPGKEMKKKLLEKINTMRILEREWQENYFSLMEKEEKIKKEEAELKSALSDFIKLCKKHKRSE